MPTQLNMPPVSHKPKGEKRIWLTGLGLSCGLLMIVGFLGIIAFNGLEAFWPKRAWRIELSPGAPGEKGDVFYGNIARETGKNSHSGQEEYQIFTGGKEVYGQSFRYIPKDRIVSMEKPADLLEIERLQGGKTIVNPVKLVTVDGSEVAAGSSGFVEKLDQLVSESEDLRDSISHIEKGRIGRINENLGDVKRSLKALEMSYDFSATPPVERPNPVVSAKDPVAKKAKLEGEMHELEGRYEECMAEIKGLRDKEGKNLLYYTLGDGAERSMVVDGIVRFIQPNKPGLFGRIGILFERIWFFISENPREANTEGGVFPAIFGTFVMTVLMSLLVTPVGVIAAIYLREYAKQGYLVKIVRICVNNLAGVPSIVFGVFGLGFFVYFVGGGIDSLFFSEKLAVSHAPTFGTSGVLWASLTLALMTLPVVIVSTEEALVAVPRGLREAALACGASKWQMIQRIIIPGALPGILTGVILAMARGAGEVAPLMVTGVVKLAADLPIDFDFPFVHLERKFMHLGYHIYDVGFQSPDSDAARAMVFATTLLLILLVVVMNLAAIMIRNHLKKQHKLSSF